MQTMRYGARHDIPVGRLCGYGGGAPIAAVPAALRDEKEWRMGASGTTRTTTRRVAPWVGLAVSLTIGLGPSASYASRPSRPIIDSASTPLSPGASAHLVVNA